MRGLQRISTAGAEINSVGAMASPTHARIVVSAIGIARSSTPLRSIGRTTRSSTETVYVVNAVAATRDEERCRNAERVGDPLQDVEVPSRSTIRRNEIERRKWRERIRRIGVIRRPICYLSTGYQDAKLALVAECQITQLRLPALTGNRVGMTNVP
jgi:hypothetical protein